MTRFLRSIALVAGAALVPAVALIASCASDSGSGSAATSGDGSVADRTRLDAPIVIHVDASASADGAAAGDAAGSCTVVIDTPPLQPANHVAIGTPVDYDSNPPSSGPHYPIWAAFQEFAAPVDRRYYVHDLEHGAIVFVYNCAMLAGPPTADGGGPCQSVVEALRAAVASLPDDPLCAGTGVRVRAVITPDPFLDVPLAAAAWGWTYRAGCLDLPSLEAFAQGHYGQGTEQLCANGQTQF